MPNLNIETKVYHSCTALRAYVRMGQSLAGLRTNARCTSSVGYPSVIIYSLVYFYYSYHYVQPHEMRPRYITHALPFGLMWEWDRAWRVCTPTLDVLAMLDTLGLLFIYKRKIVLFKIILALLKFKDSKILSNILKIYPL